MLFSKKALVSGLLILPLLHLSSQATAQVCQEWSAPQAVGALDTDFIGEASGLSVSKQYPGRFYHNNDSRDGGFFYITNLEGRETIGLSVPDMNPRDVEDLDVGPCWAGECVFLADIGDNDSERSNINIWIIPEVDWIVEGPANAYRVANARKLVLQYSDGSAHNAESMAVHPTTGDLYILTKERGSGDDDNKRPAKLFRVSRDVVAQAVAPTGGSTAAASTLELVGEIDIPKIADGYKKRGMVATSMDISPDGTRLVVLTYQNIIEIAMDRLTNSPIQSGSWQSGVDHLLTGLRDLTPQQEAITYSADGRSLYFDTELDDAQSAPIYKLDCLRF